MHERTNIQLSAADRKELEAVVANRNSPQKHVWRAKIVLLTADGHGTAEVMRGTGKAKTVIWRSLNVLDGKIIGQCMTRHHHQEFTRFLNVIDARVAKKKTVHVIVDNYAAHKHPKVLEWIENHRRFVFHFTPTSASWLNAVESFFAKLTKKRLKRGVFRSLQELKDAIHRFLDDTNANPKPFTWTKDPNKIVAAVKRAHQVLDSIH